MFEQEVQVLEMVQRSKFVVWYHGWFEEDDAWYIVLGYCPGGNLAKVVDRAWTLSHDTAQMMIAEVVAGMQALHEQGIVHGGMKPENIIVDADGHCIMTDFGFSVSGVTQCTSGGGVSRRYPFLCCTRGAGWNASRHGSRRICCWSHCVRGADRSELG
jgi:serine/threonine protein kinase